MVQKSENPEKKSHKFNFFLNFFFEEKKNFAEKKNKKMLSS
jgi:hypothetical protein